MIGQFGGLGHQFSDIYPSDGHDHFRAALAEHYLVQTHGCHGCSFRKLL